MMNTKEKLVKTTDESIETTREVLKTSLASIEKLTQINLNASKKFLEDTTKALKQMTNLNNPKELFEHINQLAKHTAESNMSNCREVYDIISQTQQKIGKMLENHIQATRKNVASATEQFTKLNPTHKSSFAADAVKSWMNSANQAMEAINKMATQVSNFGSSKPKTATKTTAATAKKATKK